MTLLGNKRQRKQRGTSIEQRVSALENYIAMLVGSGDIANGAVKNVHIGETLVVGNTEADVTADSNFVAVTYPADQADIQTQIDGKIVSWFQNSDPQPTWDGTDVSHAGDMWWNTNSKKLKRWSGSAWSSNIEDQKAIDAYADAATAQDTADGKRRVFTATPTTPYDVGDLWSTGPSGDLKKCKIARASGVYQAGDWELASKYDKTADSAQPYSWISGSKPPSNADHTASIVSAMAYESMVEKAKLGTTILLGGYIKTDLLTANNILTGILTAITVRTNDATYPHAVMDSGGLTVNGQYMTFKGTTGISYGEIYGSSTYGLMMSSFSGKNCFINGANYLTLNAGGAYLYLKQGNSTKIQISSTEIINGVTMRPSAANTKDLGTSSFKFRHLHLDQNLYMDSGQYHYWNGTSYYLRHDGTQFVINDDLQPALTNTSRLGYSTKKWYAVHTDRYYSCPLPTVNSGMNIFRKIKKPTIQSGKDYHAGKRHYFKTAEFPREMKSMDKDTKETDIELTRTLGVTVGAVRELVEKFDELDNRLKTLENNKKL